MALDPIVSLAVGISESPGAYAFLLGSGVSRDAGVPTGGEVFWQTVGALYRLEIDTTETPEAEALSGWLSETGRADLNYSSLLELLAPTQEERRAYLAQFFENHEPGDAHRRLAALAVQGMVRVFVTTNFDRLLEHALREVGVEPVVVTSDPDLAAAPAREHAGCFVLKIHGDYLQQTIRNTPAELATLEPQLTVELQSVFDRYGVVVLGYSGSDAAVAAALRARRSRYGLYWVANALAEPAQLLVEATGGRHVARTDAATFLTDLARRLEVYRAHPSGETPSILNAEVINLLRHGDDVGLRELMKRLRREIEEIGRTAILARRNSTDRADLVSFAAEMQPALERYLAVLLPLVEHRSPFLEDEIGALALLGSRRHFDSGLTIWIEMPQWFAWLIANIVGGFAVIAENLEAVRLLLTTEMPGERAPLGEFWPGSSGHEVGVSVMQVLEPSQNYYLPSFEHATRLVADSDFLKERYPEFAGTKKRVVDAMNAFSFLATLHAALNQRQVLASWAIYGDGAEEYARQIRESATYRARVAAALDTTDETLANEGNELLARGVIAVRGYRASDAYLSERR
jgi:hypothetical protein